MKKIVLRILVGLSVGTVIFLAGCGAAGGRTCHRCGDTLTSDALTANGRYYCSYDCYMSEVFFD